MTLIRLNGFTLDFGDGRERVYRTYGDPESGTVSASRVHPDPEHGKGIASASRLDTEWPLFDLPSNWSDSEALRASLEMRNDFREWRGADDVQ